MLPDLCFKRMLAVCIHELQLGDKQQNGIQGVQIYGINGLAIVGYTSAAIKCSSDFSVWSAGV